MTNARGCVLRLLPLKDFQSAALTRYDASEKKKRGRASDIEFNHLIGRFIAARERTAPMRDILFGGIGWTALAMTLNRIAVGAFFMLSGFHKLFDAPRHRTFVDELKALGVPAVGFNQWWVPLVEFSAGGAVLIGLLAPLAALGLLVIILVAIATSGRQRIKLYKPIDEADRIDDWLYLPETLYAFMLIIIVSAGAGPYSFDALILGLINKHAA
jgi:uncharacterized membrane protein YphA (DoxX/SURF4 family)